MKVTQMFASASGKYVEFTMLDGEVVTYDYRSYMIMPEELKELYHETSPIAAGYMREDAMAEYTELMNA